MDADFLIIGAGVAGLSAAQALCQAGARVTLVDSGTCGGEASWAGGGILSMLPPWDYPEEVARLALRGAALFGAWADDLRQSTGIDPEYAVSGMEILPPFDREKARAWCAAHGMPLTEQDNGTLFLPEVAQVRNPRLLRALRARVEELGGHILERCPVHKLLVREGRVRELEAACGELKADHYILSAGAWTREVLGEHAMDLNITPVRGQMLLYKFDAPPLQHIMLQEHFYLIPRADGHLLAGSTSEDAGFDKSTTEEAKEMLMARTQALLPQVKGMEPVRHWAGLRPGSPENIPAIGPHPHLANLYVNSGHFRYGVTMAPASTEILINDLTGKPQPFDVTPYRKRWGA